VNFAVITLCVASQRVFIVVAVYFVIDSIRKFWILPHMYVSRIRTRVTGVPLVDDHTRLGSW